jgi:hypothetical protein
MSVALELGLWMESMETSAEKQGCSFALCHVCPYCQAGAAQRAFLPCREINYGYLPPANDFSVDKERALVQIQIRI